MDYVDRVSQVAFEMEHKPRHNHTQPIPIYPGLDHITESGTRTLWVVFFIMLVSSAGVLALTLRQQAHSRVFHQVTFFITAFATIAYYGMATGAGSAFIIIPGQHKVRELLWARYANWIVTTPLILIDLTLLAGLPGTEIVLVIIADLGMVLTTTFAAFSDHSKSRWGFYAFSGLFFLYIIYSLVISSRTTSFRRSERVGKLFTSLTAFTLVVWICYPIASGLCEVTGRLSPNQEVLFYGILDILAMPVFGFWLLIAHKNIAESHVILPSSWTQPRGAAGGYGALGSSAPSLS